jgi:hypothetical protein
MPFLLPPLRGRVGEGLQISIVMEQKKWYQSKTILVNLCLWVASVFTELIPKLIEIDYHGVIENGAANYVKLAFALFATINIVLRFRTTNPVKPVFQEN